MVDMRATRTGIAGRLLCVADFRVDGPVMRLGASPWRNRRVGYIDGGAFEGPDFSGVILPGGGNWSDAGVDETGASLIQLDARTVWRTQDGAIVYLTYYGRAVIPADLIADFATPAIAAAIDPARYSFRIAPLFETADARYAWLNRLVCVGFGRRMAHAMRYEIFALD